MRRPLLALIAAALVAGRASAEDATLSPARLAEVEYAEARAQREVDAKYGNRRPSELSSDQRRAQIRDRQAASMRVLREHGVDAKAYARRTATLTPSEQEQVASARAELERRGSAPADAPHDQVEFVRGDGDGAVEDPDALEGARPAVEPDGEPEVEVMGATPSGAIEVTHGEQADPDELEAEAPTPPAQRQKSKAKPARSRPSRR